MTDKARVAAPKKDSEVSNSIWNRPNELTNAGLEASHHQIRYLQRTVGNRTVGQLLKSGFLMTKSIGNISGNTLKEQIQRQEAEATEGYSDVESQIRKTIQHVGLDIDGLDVTLLSQYYPEGIRILPEIVVATAVGPSAIHAAKIPGYRITPIQQLASGYVTYLLHVGHGRGIVLHETGGRTVMLDAARLSAEGLAALRSAGLVNIPEAIRISHGHGDHFQGLDRVLAQSGMEDTKIEIARQTFRNAVAEQTWLKLGLKAETGSRIVEINVSGTGIHMDKRVFGNMVITELRLVSAAQRVEQAQSRQEYSAAQNPSAPVTIVQDRVTGKIQMFTADGTPGVFSEMVDVVGERAFMEMIGIRGRQLERAEEPHHGGSVSGTEAGIGYLRRLWMMMEASGGKIELIAQTDPDFVNRPTSSIRFLQQIGEGVTEIHGPTGAERGVPVTERRGGGGQTLEIDKGSIVQVRQMIQQAQGPLREAFQAREEIKRLGEEIHPLKVAFSQGSLPEHFRSMEQLERELKDMDKPIADKLTETRNAMEAAIRKQHTLRADMDLSDVRGKLGALRQVIGQRRDLNRVRNSIKTHRQMMTLAEALSANAIEMLTAFRGSQFQRVHQLRAAQETLLRLAAAELGSREVAGHVKHAWDLTRVRQATKGLSKVLAMHRIAQSHGIAGITLAQQLRLNRIVELASQGMLPSSRGLRQGRGARIGAGILLALEALYMIVELSEQVEAGMEAAEIRSANKVIRGRNMVSWWLQRGVVPTLAMLDEDDEQVELSQDKIYEALKHDDVEGVPENAYIVVTNVSREDRLAAIAQLEMRVHNIDDWYNVVEDGRHERHEHGWQPFTRLDDGRWATLEYNMEEEKYLGSFDQEVHRRLSDLYSLIRRNTSEELEAFGGERTTIDDTAFIIGEDRFAWVHNEFGNFERINFRDFKPSFVKYKGSYVKGQVGNEDLTVVQAADAETYIRLRRFRWPTGQEHWYAHGFAYGYAPNHSGLCYVKTEDLIPLKKD